MNDKMGLIIAAAGSGSRMKADKNKILLDLEGKLVLERTLDKFLGIDEIIQLIVVAKEDEIDEIKSIVSGYSFDNIKVVAGGSSRQESIENGLKQLLDAINYVIVHDAARPFIKKEYINSAILMAKEHKACGVGVKVKDSLKEVDSHGMIIDSLDRSKIWQIQTPQIFEVSLLKKAYNYAKKTGFCGTDDSSLVEHMGSKVAMFEGDYKNIKLTTVEDMDYASFMLRRGE